MESVVNAVNEKTAITLGLDIMKYYDRISELFDKLDLEMSDVKDIIDGDSYKSIDSNYKMIRSNFYKIKTSINNYADDYACLVRKMKDTTNKINFLFEEYTRDIQKNTKTIK